MTVYAILSHTYWIPKVDDSMMEMNGVYQQMSFITAACGVHFPKSSVILFAG